MAAAKFLAAAGDPSGEFSGLSNFTIFMNDQDATSMVNGTYYDKGMANRIDVVGQAVTPSPAVTLPSASQRVFSWQLFTAPTSVNYGVVVCLQGTSAPAIQAGAYELFKLTVPAAGTSVAANEPAATAEF